MFMFYEIFCNFSGKVKLLFIKIEKDKIVKKEKLILSFKEDIIRNGG